MGSLCSKCLEKKEDQSPIENTKDFKDQSSNASPSTKRFNGLNKITPETASDRDYRYGYDSYSKKFIN